MAYSQVGEGSREWRQARECCVIVKSDRRQLTEEADRRASSGFADSILV